MPLKVRVPRVFLLCHLAKFLQQSFEGIIVIEILQMRSLEIKRLNSLSNIIRLVSGRTRVKLIKKFLSSSVVTVARLTCYSSIDSASKGDSK